MPCFLQNLYQPLKCAAGFYLKTNVQFAQCQRADAALAQIVLNQVFPGRLHPLHFKGFDFHVSIAILQPADYPHIIFFTVSALTLRPEMITTAGSVNFSILPARQAAMGTAAEGSIKY